MNFATRIKELRKSKNLTQKQLAEAVNITERACRYYESGAREPSFSALIALADFFDVSLDYITARSDNPEVNK